MWHTLNRERTLKLCITGFSGFVAKHFLDLLNGLGEVVEVRGLDINPPPFDFSLWPNVRCSYALVDLMDQEKVMFELDQFKPDMILHLAAFSSVAFSWKNPALSFQNNINIYLNLLEGVRNANLHCRILSVGSSEEYGNISADRLPLREDYPLDPVSPYAVARVSQEMLSRVYIDGFGLDIVMTRSFNHVGPGQRDSFVIPSFARQIAAIKRGGLEPLLVTGDLSVVRDFTDVRDVVQAYWKLLQKGECGQIYNVCSGQGQTLASLVEQLAAAAGIAVRCKTDLALVRPNDNRAIIGSREKIKQAVGWEPQISLKNTLIDIMTEWLAK